MKTKVIISWSGGKDSALALYEIQKQKEYEIVALLTTVTEDYNRISMHGIRWVLLNKQAQSIGIPLEKIIIPKKASNQEYQRKMKMVLLQFKKRGVSSVVFGDIFLEDLRTYREKKLTTVGIEAIFPLWKRSTRYLAYLFIQRRFKAITTCVDTKVLDKKFVGRYFNRRFLSKLPSKIDPCGENGEFHSFVYAGPIFKKRIRFTKGKKVLRNDRFYYFDIKPF